MPSKNKRMPVAGKQILEFNILDAETKKRVIKCIKERGKISVSLQHTGIIADVPDGGFQQKVD